MASNTFYGLAVVAAGLGVAYWKSRKEHKATALVLTHLAETKGEITIAYTDGNGQDAVAYELPTEKGVWRALKSQEPLPENVAKALTKMKVDYLVAFQNRVRKSPT